MPLDTQDANTVLHLGKEHRNHWNSWDHQAGKRYRPGRELSFAGLAWAWIFLKWRAFRGTRVSCLPEMLSTTTSSLVCREKTPAMARTPPGGSLALYSRLWPQSVGSNGDCSKNPPEENFVFAKSKRKAPALLGCSALKVGHELMSPVFAPFSLSLCYRVRMHPTRGSRVQEAGKNGC